MNDDNPNARLDFQNALRRNPGKAPYEVIFSVEPPDQILGMTQYQGKVIVATTKGVYKIEGLREGEIKYSISKVEQITR